MKHSLGRRAFLLFLSRRMKFVLFLFALTAVAWMSAQWIPPDRLVWQVWQDYIAKLISLITGAYFLLILIWTYMEYRVYTYSFTEEAFVMTSGLVVRDEVTALYHQIQNVNIHRTPSDRLAGVSQVVIYMAGADKSSLHSQVILPAISKKKAKWVQKELLERARRHIPKPYSEEEDDEA